MIAVGEAFPEVTVFGAPGEAVSLTGVAEGSRELELLRDRSAQFEAAGVRIFGV